MLMLRSRHYALQTMEAIPILSACFPGFGPWVSTKAPKWGPVQNEVTTRYKEES